MSLSTNNNKTPVIAQVSGHAAKDKKKTRLSDIFDNLDSANERDGNEDESKNDAILSELGFSTTQVHRRKTGTTNRTSEALQNSNLIGRSLTGTPNKLQNEKVIPELGFGGVADGSGVLDQLALSGLNPFAPGSTGFGGGFGFPPFGGAGFGSGSGSTGGKKNSDSNTSSTTGSSNSDTSGTTRNREPVKPPKATENDNDSLDKTSQAQLIAKGYNKDASPEDKAEYLQKKLGGNLSQDQIQAIIDAFNKSEEEGIEKLEEILEEGEVPAIPPNDALAAISPGVQNNINRVFAVGFGDVV